MSADPFAMPLCSICMTAVDAEEPTAACPSCHAPYHADCWTDNGGCAVYGCTMVPTTEGLKPIEIPPAFWGREDKNCPVCNAVIAAIAVRCRHCGANVEARPEERTAYDRRQLRRQRAPGLRRIAVVLVILSLIPIVAAVAAIGGWLFYKKRGDEIRKLPGSYDGLYRIAIGVAAAQSAIIVIAVLAFTTREMLR